MSDRPNDVVDLSTTSGPEVLAQITLALVEFVQTALAVAARSYMRVLPNPLPLRRNDVVTTLALMPKPVRVAPLAQPGAIGTWPYEPTTELERTLFEQRARKAQSRVNEILEPFTKNGSPVRVLLEHESAAWVVSSDAVTQWSKDYVLDGVGWILVASHGDERAPVRFILARPDGTWFPSAPLHPLASDVAGYLEEANGEASRYEHDAAGTEHVLLAMSRGTDPALQEVFKRTSLSYPQLDDALSRIARRGPSGMRPRMGAYTSRLRNALESAARISKDDGNTEIGALHLLKAMLLDASAATVLAEVLATCGRSTEALCQVLDTTSPPALSIVSNGAAVAVDQR